MIRGMEREQQGQEQIGQVDVDPERIAQIGFEIGGVPVEAVLLPDNSTPEYAVGAEDTMNDQGDRVRKYLKLPKRLREAGHTVVEYYHDHESLAKGVGAVSVIAGVITVGTLVVRRLKKR